MLQIKLRYSYCLLAVAAAVAILPGCGGGAGNTSNADMMDGFSTLNSATWEVKASVSCTDGKLNLDGSSGAAEVTGAAAYNYKSLSATAQSTTWSAGTSFGFDSTTSGQRQAVIVNQGKLYIINDTASGTKQASVAIDQWSTYSTKSTAYQIVWQAGKVDLYADNKLVATYSGTLVPSASLALRFASDSGKLTIDQVAVGDSSSTLFSDDFTSFNTAAWNVDKGSLAAVIDGRLHLRSTAQAPAEVLSRAEYTFRELDLTAEGDWSPDTYVGFYGTVVGGHSQVGVSNGNYVVSNQLGTRAEPIANWSTTKQGSCAFRIRWANGFSQLLVNSWLQGGYSDEYLTTSAAKIRIVVGTAQPGELLVDGVEIKKVY